ncbi:MAG: outer membrane protein transport protein [Candidatus Marinimicrobia bacterium]|nr:outer membrane protein transport protein [Candidatus Neomarinimicrobiota bacterium]
MKNSINLLFRTLTLLLTLSTALMGQSYFNALFIDQLNTNNAEDMALSGANTSGYSSPFNTFNNPANQGQFKGLSVTGSVAALATNENRSYPAIDQFGDRVTDNIYVVSRGLQSTYSAGISWGTGKLGVSMASTPFLTPAFFFKEEIRGSLYPPNVNRDPLIGYHHVEQTGVIQGTGASLASSFGSLLLGAGVRILHGIGLESQFGVSVINDADTSALASGTTFLKTETWSLDNSPLVINLGVIKDLNLHWRVSASYQSKYTLESQRQSAIPTWDSTLVYGPLLSWNADSLLLTTEIPAKFEVGLRMRPSNPLPTSVYISIAYQDWSQYSLSYGDSLADGTKIFDYPMQETFTISGGVEHWVTEHVPFRAGFSWIESPLADKLAQSRFSAGSGWVSGPFQFDIAVQLSTIQYTFTDIFTPTGLTPNVWENVRETNTNYSFSVSYKL